MLQKKIIPLLKNIYSTNPLSVQNQRDRVINHKKEIKWFTFSPDDRFLLVNDEEKTTLYQLGKSSGSRAIYSIPHNNDIYSVRFGEDGQSFTLISDKYDMTRYSLEGIRLSSSHVIENKNVIPHSISKPWIGNHIMAWPEWGPRVNVYDFYLGHYLIKELALENFEDGYVPLSIRVRLDSGKVFLLMIHPGSRTGQVFVIDIELQKTDKLWVIQDVRDEMGNNVYEVSACGGYMAAYTQDGECWIYDLQGGEEHLAFKYNRFYPAKIHPVGTSSFLCTVLPEDDSDGYNLIVYDPTTRSRTKQFHGLQFLYHPNHGPPGGVRAEAFFQISDDFKYLMGFTGNYISVWDTDKIEVTGKFESGQKQEIGTTTLSARGNYLAVIKNRQIIFIYDREELPCTTRSDLPGLKLHGYPYVSRNKYLMYRCDEETECPSGYKYYYKFLKFPKLNRIYNRGDIQEQGAIRNMFRDYYYLGETGYFVCSRMVNRLYFYSIETGKKVLDLRLLVGFGINSLEHIAVSEAGNRVAALTAMGRIKVYDTSYLLNGNYSSLIPVPRCIKKIRATPLFSKKKAYLIAFISEDLLFIGYSNGDVKIVDILSSRTISKNNAALTPHSVRIINDQMLLIITDRERSPQGKIRISLWNHSSNHMEPIKLRIGGRDCDIDAFRVSDQSGFLAVAINNKGVYTINIHRPWETRKLGDLGRINAPFIYFKLFGIFELLSKNQLLIIDVASEEWEEPCPKKRIRIWDINTGEPVFREDTFLEDYEGIDILLEKYLVLWTKDDNLLKIYDLNLNQLLIAPISDFQDRMPTYKKIKAWGDKLITMGNDLNIFQII